MDNYRNNGLLLILVVVLILILFSSPLIKTERIDGSTLRSKASVVNAANFSRMNTEVAAINNTTGTDANSNFTSIFDGKSLDGWRMSGGGKFQILYDEKAIQSRGGLGILWYTKQQFGNFVLQLEWRVASESDNSGVFIRVPNLSNDYNVAVREGYEVQINNRGEDSLHQTGAIAGFAAPRNVVLKPAGQWNTMEIHTMDQSYKVFINNAKVIEFTGKRSIEGYVGLQAHDDKSKVAFRNIRVSDIK